MKKYKKLLPSVPALIIIAGLIAMTIWTHICGLSDSADLLNLGLKGWLNAAVISAEIMAIIAIVMFGIGAIIWLLDKYDKWRKS